MYFQDAILKIVMVKGCDVGLRFSNKEQMATFATDIKARSVRVYSVDELKAMNNGSSLPDLNDGNVQEFVLQLLFSDDFKDFVEQLGELLNSFSDRTSC